MNELSLNILDIVRNSLDADADFIEITITESNETLTLSVKDNGRGMNEEEAAAALNPFYTTKPGRRYGMGIPLLKLAAERTGGTLSIESHPRDERSEGGTKIKAGFYKSHIDFVPLGDIVETVIAAIQGADGADISFRHEMPGRIVALDTRELRLLLGEDADIGDPMVLRWIKGMLTEQYAG